MTMCDKYICMYTVYIEKTNVCVYTEIRRYACMYACMYDVWRENGDSMFAEAYIRIPMSAVLALINHT